MRQSATGPTAKGPRSSKQSAVTRVNGMRPLVVGSWAQAPGRVTPHVGVLVAVAVTTQPVKDVVGTMRVVEVGGMGVKDVMELDELDEIDELDELDELIVDEDVRLAEELEEDVVEVVDEVVEAGVDVGVDEDEEVEADDEVDEVEEVDVWDVAELAT